MLSKRRVLVDLAREEALAQRAVRHEADAELLEGRQHLRLRARRPQRVFALEGRDGLDGVGPADRLDARLGEAEVLDLARLDQLLDRSRHVLDRHVRVDAVLIEQVDDVDPEPLERGLDGLLDVLRPAVQARPAPAGGRLGLEVEPELGGDHDLVAERGQGLAHELLVRERAVDLGGVEEGDAAFDGRPEQRDHLLLVLGRAVREAHAHAAEPDGRDFQVAVSEFAFLHCLSFEWPWAAIVHPLGPSCGRCPLSRCSLERLPRKSERNVPPKGLPNSLGPGTTTQDSGEYVS